MKLPTDHESKFLGTVPPGCSEKWTDIEGCRVRFLHAGAGAPLVLLHGLLGYSFSWRRVIGPLAEGREVFAPDLPGSGFSDCKPSLDCRLNSSARRLSIFLDHMGLSRCDLVASSYGGATALMLASHQPPRFRRMILVSPANPWSTIGRKRIRLLQVPLIRWLFPWVGQKSRFLHDFFLRRLYGDPSQITPGTYCGYSDPVALGGRLEHAVRIVQSWGADMEELRLALPRARNIPVLLVWGKRDRAVDPASAEALARNFASARIALIEGAGHLPYEERPEEFVVVVRGFLAGQNGK